MADGALRLPSCPLRLPFLFPKISLRCDLREPYKMRVEGSLKIMLEKGKTTLLPFSPYSGELPAGKVNLRGVYKREPLNRRAKRKTPIAPSCKRGQWGFLQITAFRRQQPAEERVNRISYISFPITTASSPSP